MTVGIETKSIQLARGWAPICHEEDSFHLQQIALESFLKPGKDRSELFILIINASKKRVERIVNKIFLILVSNPGYELQSQSTDGFHTQSLAQKYRFLKNDTF